MMRGSAQRPERPSEISGRGAARCTPACSLDPEAIERVSRVSFAELHRAGVRTVGEFHYVHHQPEDAVRPSGRS